MGRNICPKKESGRKGAWDIDVFVKTTSNTFMKKKNTFGPNKWSKNNMLKCSTLHAMRAAGLVGESGPIDT